MITQKKKILENNKKLTIYIEEKREMNKYNIKYATHSQPIIN